MKAFHLPRGDVAAEEGLNAFLRGNRVVRVDRAWGGDGWEVLVEWLEGAGDGGGGAASGGRWSERKVDYREVLEEAAFARFARLREIRKALAKEEAVPPYVVMTDAQMAEAAKAERVTLADLRKIPGWGEGRVAKYGARLLEALGAEGEGTGGNGSPERPAPPVTGASGDRSAEAVERGVPGERGAGAGR